MKLALYQIAAKQLLSLNIILDDVDEEAAVELCLPATLKLSADGDKLLLVKCPSYKSAGVCRKIYSNIGGRSRASHGIKFIAFTRMDNFNLATLASFGRTQVAGYHLADSFDGLVIDLGKRLVDITTPINENRSPRKTRTGKVPKEAPAALNPVISPELRQKIIYGANDQRQAKVVASCEELSRTVLIKAVAEINRAADLGKYELALEGGHLVIYERRRLTDH